MLSWLAYLLKTIGSLRVLGENPKHEVIKKIE